MANIGPKVLERHRGAQNIGSSQAVKGLWV